MSQATLNHSVTRTHGFTPLSIEGRLPAALRGTAFRVGPGLLERFGQPVAHPFDADGAVTAVRFSEHGAEGACRIVESGRYLEEERAGRYLYGFSARMPRRLTSVLRGQLKSTANTNVLWWQGQLYGLMEASLPIALDATDLRTGTPTELGVVTKAFSAHPHRVAALQTTFNFGLSGKTLALYALPDHGPARRLASVRLPCLAMVHDFIVTAKHAVFLIGPAKLNAWKALISNDVANSMTWRPAEGTLIVVVPLAAPQRVRQFRVPAFWVWHFTNAFEQGDEIVVDFIRHETAAAFQAPSAPGPTHGQPTLYRLRLNHHHEEVDGEGLLQLPVEFPSVHPGWTGARHRYAWLQTFPSPTQHPGVARLDLETHALEAWQAPRHHLGSEPMFVPHGPKEGHGFILQLMQDPSLQRSYMAVLDAAQLAAGPLAKVWFDHPIPMTFHGQFVSA